MTVTAGHINTRAAALTVGLSAGVNVLLVHIIGWMLSGYGSLYLQVIGSLNPLSGTRTITPATGAAGVYQGAKSMIETVVFAAVLGLCVGAELATFYNYIVRALALAPSPKEAARQFVRKEQ